MVRQRIAVLLVLLLFVVRLAAGEDADVFREAIYARLDQICETKHEQLMDYLKRIRSSARAIRTDRKMLDYFAVKRTYHRLRRTEDPPDEAVRAIERLKRSIRQHYLEHYPLFYDILFVDRSGFVISAMRREGDYHKNLFKGELAKTALSRRLREHPVESFVDYEFYQVSDEPSAFFIEPAVIKDTRAGWFVLQCAINRINRIFAQDKRLGRTGEVFLVNRE